MKNVRRTLAIWCGLVGLVTAGCGPLPGPRLDGWYAPIHNTLQAFGFAQVGPLHSGSVGERQAQTLSMPLAAGRCYAFVGMGSRGVSELELVLVSPSGQTVGRDRTTGRQAVLQACPEATGEHVLVVRMAQGAGDFAVATWASSGGLSAGMAPSAGVGLELPHGGIPGIPGLTGVATGTAPPAPPGPRGTCDEPLPLAVGDTISGGTSGAMPIALSCAGTGGPASIYALTVEESAFVTIAMGSPYDGSLALWSQCGVPTSELVCNDDAGNPNSSRVSSPLQPGTYYVIVSGFNGQHGTFDLTVTAESSGDLDEMCTEAPRLTSGETVSGTTAGSADRFQASCASGAGSPDALYQLEVAERARVRIALHTPSHDGCLHLRRTCYDRSSELTCNDDSTDANHSAITQTLDAGTYYVIVDGYGPTNAGSFTLRADVVPFGAGAGAGDTCEKAERVADGARVQGTTTDAAGHLQGSCAMDPAAPDRVYLLEVEQETRLRATLPVKDFNAAIYVQSRCGDTSTEIGCSTAELDRVLSPGTYALVVDGQGADDFGEYVLSVDLESAAGLRATCEAAPAIAPGNPIQDATSGFSHFSASCGKDARGPEKIYRLVIERHSRVRILVQSGYDAVLHLRSDCIRPETEMACNDDHGDRDKAMIETALAPGTYYVFVDTYDTGAGGTFSLAVWLE